jgi:Fe-S oxidoreductase
MTLPLVQLRDEPAKAARYCTYCPKMCRFACPVAEATKRETHTPWGMMTLLNLAAGGRAPTEDASSWWACSGCLRCRTYCVHENDVPHALYAARAAAFAAGAAPAACAEVADAFRARGCAEPGDLRAAVDALPPGDPTSRTLLFAGCEAALREPGDARDAVAAAQALGAPVALHTGEPLCCGLDLLEAGAREEFRTHARWMRKVLRGAGAVVALSARCAHALRVRYAEVGEPLTVPVLHVTTYLRPLVEHAARTAPRPKLPGPVTYHDPCMLGRGLGEYDAPRAILRAVCEGGAAEPPRTREASDCCGASGLLPRTMPDAAREMARRRAEELSAGGRPVATASASCRGALAGAGAETSDVVNLVARWLEGSK